jgi:hypothetical protein
VELNALLYAVLETVRTVRKASRKGEFATKANIPVSQPLGEMKATNGLDKNTVNRAPQQSAATTPPHIPKRQPIERVEGNAKIQPKMNPGPSAPITSATLPARPTSYPSSSYDLVRRPEARLRNPKDWLPSRQQPKPNTGSTRGSPDATATDSSIGVVKPRSTVKWSPGLKPQKAQDLPFPSYKTSEADVKWQNEWLKRSKGVEFPTAPLRNSKFRSYQEMTDQNALPLIG